MLEGPLFLPFLPDYSGRKEELRFFFYIKKIINKRKELLLLPTHLTTLVPKLENNSRLACHHGNN